MLLFFGGQGKQIYVVETIEMLTQVDIEKLKWLFGDAEFLDVNKILGTFIGSRREMITPWSTNAVEITQNMGINGIYRIEQFFRSADAQNFDPMLQEIFKELNKDIFQVYHHSEPIIKIKNIKEYNEKEGLALNDEEVEYLENLSKKLKRELTDSEVFGFSQVNSEHCRHKIFNGTFVLEGKQMPETLFSMIKKTSSINNNKIVSAYKDNVAFIEGPVVQQFAPKSQDQPDFFEIKSFESVISLKAETHNFPTTVEPFNGAATGSGGEIRDRMAGGKGSVPLAGTAVYMTSYPRLGNKKFDSKLDERKWLYQTPLDILIKASNGASDFGNKFGQPLIAGSILTFEHEENNKKLAYDKVIMLAGGIGFAKRADSIKGNPIAGDKIMILGGENYRIGMGGSAVSSVDTGEYNNSVELNAIQRSNPEMQKRTMNAIRAMIERDKNPIVSIHDHGAGGHLNSLSELVEETGGIIYSDKLPKGDKTLSDKELIGNESQERMGVIMKKEDIEFITKVSERERAPVYIVGEVTGDKRFKINDEKLNQTSIDLSIVEMFGSTPKTVMNDLEVKETFKQIGYNSADFHKYLENTLRLESVASKDWLTNKVDRSVTGKVAKQQTCGSLQLPLNNVGVMTLDYTGDTGVATSIGHSPISALIDPEAGSKNSIAEALTNIIWAPLAENIKSISLSANWMWPAKNKGEDARLYKAVKAASEFAIQLGINIPTGKDSLSMTQKYENEKVISPGTVIISAVGEVVNVKKVVEPVLKLKPNNALIYIDMSSDELRLGGSAFAQTLNKIGKDTPTIKNPAYFVQVFDTIQMMIKQGKIIAGHDISSGGMITTLLEMCFAEKNLTAEIDLTSIEEDDIIKIFFAENSGIIIQVLDAKDISSILRVRGIKHHIIGQAIQGNQMKIKLGEDRSETIDIPSIRDIWFETSYLLDAQQTTPKYAKKRFENYKENNLKFKFPEHFLSNRPSLIGKTEKPKAAIIREKGVNGDREMAYAMYLAGFDVKDVHMTDLASGRENLENVKFIAFAGGFSNSDVLGSAKGWAGAFRYNEKAKLALESFYKRADTLSLGVCNGCQLMVELNLINPDHDKKSKMLHNDSNKFESGFVGVKIPENNSVMLHTLSNTELGVWVAHGEGKFYLPKNEENYNIVLKYSYPEYPANPNGSDYNVAAICSSDGRHLAMMPHIERSIFPWNWAKYDEQRINDEVTPWIEAFINAKKWIENQV